MIFTHMIQETPRTHRAIRNRWIVFGFVIACLALLVPRIVSGQASAGITGTITDTSGAVVTNAKVTATELSTSAANHTVSSSVGTYAFKGLNPGKYTVTVEASGFKKAVQEAVTVEVSTTATIDFTVSAGTANETVQVTAAQIALNTTAPETRQHYRAGGRRGAAGRSFGPRTPSRSTSVHGARDYGQRLLPPRQRGCRLRAGNHLQRHPGPAAGNRRLYDQFQPAI